MAATDKHYRDQNTLDIVFALSNLAMLLGMVLMLIQDYNREYKVEQRVFRDVEVAMAQRAALEKLPDGAEFEEAKKDVVRAQKQRKEIGSEIAQKRGEIHTLLPDRDNKEVRFQTVKADLESLASFYDIEVEHHGPDSSKAKRYREQLKTLQEKVDAAKAERDTVLAEIRKKQNEVDELESPLVKAAGKLKKLTDQFDAQVKIAVRQRWGVGDWFRTWPILDAFASPIKIHQYVIDDVPIDYNFKYVTRFDRCATCHLGIARPEFSRDNLTALRGITNEQDYKATVAKQMLKERRDIASDKDKDSIPNPDDLKLLTLDKSRLTDARITEFCAHPRLDLYVGATSKHPAEKVGCTSCHAGQGSSTSFVLASHTPNTSDQEHHWKDKYHWESQHMWDFPMLPKRFIESSCLKCHHQVTDLISTDNRSEAPKLLQGFNIIKDVGCFGCHEIQGRKAGRNVGPDLRLESSPPLEDLTPAQRARVESDPDTAPGNYRKVGPSLYRLSEKTNENFVRKWIYSPRSFRPDTKMPHYYRLETNDKSALPEDQKEFPETEVYAITRFLFNSSKGYLSEVKARKADPAKVRSADMEYQRLLNDFLDSKATMSEAWLKKLVPAAEGVKEWSKLLDRPLYGERKFAEAIGDNLKTYGGRLPPDENKTVTKLLDEELKLVVRRIQLRDKVELLSDKAAGLKGADKRGRMLFTEKGCLACHVHEGTVTAQGKPGDKDYVPALNYDAEFGPNLAQLSEKLIDRIGAEEKEKQRKELLAKAKPTKEEQEELKHLETELAQMKENPRIWLVQWLLNPTVHFPRTRMPVTHLSTQDAADIAAWLLNQKAMDLGADWHDLEVAKPGPTQLNNLAKVYLVRILARSDMNNLLDKKEPLASDLIKDLPVEEKWLATELSNAARLKEKSDEDKDLLRERTLLDYLGRKAVNRLGCYGCHDIPGFEAAKPIGVALNDWGKKPADRLAFDDINNFAKNHYHIVDRTVTETGKAVPPQVEMRDGKRIEKRTYEKYFADLLFHHTREGFLHQKLLAPRSYDYLRNRAWDDRYRMPQFQFSKFRLPPTMKVDRADAAMLQGFLDKKEKNTPADVLKLFEQLPEEGALGKLKEKIEENAGELTELPRTKPVPADKLALFLPTAESLLTQIKNRLPSDLELQGQRNLQEDKAREAVMTFVLGLVAEPVPLQSVNQPKGDRLAEVKGRQILEKYNCQSCHLVRPGYFEFKATANVRKYLKNQHTVYSEGQTNYLFPEHYFWTGNDPKNSTVKAMINWPVTSEGKAEFNLLEALRFLGPDRSMYDIGTLQKIEVGPDGIRPQDMVTPPPAAFASAGELDHYLTAHGPFGGTFGEALAKYLMEKTAKDATPLNFSNARSSTPPFLTAQGERTQPEWLYPFLLNPHPVRKMPVLRMPRFNMSSDEAKVLVEYFAAVERISNPGIGLTAPFDKIPQQEGLDSEYWQEKNREYVQRLKTSFVPAPDGTPTKTTWYQKRQEELEPIWKQIEADIQSRAQVAQGRATTAQGDFDKVSKVYEPLAADLKKAQEAYKAKKEEADKAKDKGKSMADELKALDAKVREAETALNKVQPDYDYHSRVLASWKGELEALTREAKSITAASLKTEWEGKNAYATDAFRLLLDQNLCFKCHQVGEREPPPTTGAAGTPGPNLTAAHGRLRPGWAERWINNPKYYLHYTPMPVNFEKGKYNYQPLFVGEAIDQIRAVRDVLMVYPEVAAQPASRYWALPPAIDKKKTEDKK